MSKKQSPMVNAFEIFTAENLPLAEFELASFVLLVLHSRTGLFSHCLKRQILLIPSVVMNYWP